MNDLISIIVPVYNIEKYIEKCIYSVLQQSYTNLEIIIIDDGSTDKSGNICEKLAKTDFRINIIHKENEGLAAARNDGLKAAQGKYIIFIDGDDYIDKNMVNKLHQRILHDKADLVLCNIHFVDKEGNIVADKEDELTDGVLSQKEFWAGYYGAFVYPYVVAWNKLYKKELFEHTFFEKGKIHEDEFILHQIISQCNVISVIKDKLYNYVQRDNSIMNSSYNIKRLHAFEALNIRTDYFYKSDQEYIEPTINSMLGILIKASTNLDLSTLENKERLGECIRVYRKRIVQYHKNISSYLIVKSIAFLYFRPIYLLLKKRAYIDE